MDKFLIKLPKPKDGQPSSSSNQPFMSSQVAPEVQRHTNSFPLSNMDNILDFKSLEADPKDRMPISSYCPNIRNAVRRMQDLKNQRQSIQSSFDKQSEKARSDYRMRLNASIDVARFLLTSGFPFRGHDESEGSEYKGAFLELLKWYGDRSFDVGRVILGNAPQNDMMICLTIQKDIVEACAKETTKAIIEDLDGDYFGILVDESKDVSHKEQMALILRYVNKSGMVIERFLGIVHLHLNADIHFDNIKKISWKSCLNLEKFIQGKVLLLTNELNKVLQKKDQDIVNAMGLLDLSKKRLQMMREDEWDSMMDEVSLFCGKHGISIPKMNEDYFNGKSKRKSDLLLGMASLSPVDSFANFHKDRIMKLAEYYPSEFGDKELRELNFQLDDFIVYAQKCDSKFLNLKGIKDLAKMDRDKTRSNLVTCVSTCEANFDYSVATASVERAFSSMNLLYRA
ncbi:hypothetical protein KY284_010969 [Solanum tuberosum]|nr:hypothetical protein KY284_010969 [Solanum tuberosum]